MCGIITIYNTEKNVDTNSLLELYVDQKTRGSEGFGFSWLTPKGKIKTERFTEEAEVFHRLARVKSQLVQFHHRMPTSTDNVAFQNHPICNSKHHGKIYSLIHNGIIYNDDELKERHYKEGISYSTKDKKGKFNDSETLLHELAKWIEEGSKIRIDGSVAFVLLEIEQGTHKLLKMHYGRNDANPLHAWQYGEDNVLSSECYYNIEGKDGKKVDTEIPEFKLFSLEWGTFEETTEKLPLKRSSSIFYGGSCGYGTGTGMGAWEEEGYNGILTKRERGISLSSEELMEVRDMEKEEKKTKTVKGEAAKDVTDLAVAIYNDTSFLLDIATAMTKEDVCDDVEAVRMLSDIDLQTGILESLNTARALRWKKKLYNIRIALLNWSEEVPRLLGEDAGLRHGEIVHQLPEARHN